MNRPPNFIAAKSRSGGASAGRKAPAARKDPDWRAQRGGPDAAGFWNRRIRWLKWRVNGAAWFETTAQLLFLAAAFGAIGLYAARRLELGLDAVGWSISAALVLAALFGWWRARPAFFNATQARVLLESRLSLETRLTAAEHGLTHWPAQPPRMPAVTRWRLRRPLGWVGASVLLIALAAYLPVPRPAGIAPVVATPALVEAEAMIREIQDANVAAPEAVEKLSAQVQELQDRPVAQQYDHAALEAADTLRDQIAGAAEKLAENLEMAAGSLEAAVDGQSMREVSSRLMSALAGLRLGALPVSADLLGQIPEGMMDLSSLSPEQRARLGQMLAAASQRVRNAAGNSVRGNQAANGRGGGRGGGSGRGNGGAGAGGEGGGGGSAPVNLTELSKDAGGGRVELLSGVEDEKSQPGDKMTTVMTTPEYDPKNAVGPASGGTVQSSGRGGESVWVNRLLPNEQAAVKNFFR